MAFSLGGASSFNGGRRSRFRGTSSLAEINIIPLVDVVLVLLIIFMLTAHVMEFGLEVDVPKVSQVKEGVQDFPVISITREGITKLNDKDVNIHEMASAIHQRFHNATAVYVRADGRVPWDTLAQVVAALGDAKLGVNLVTQPEDLAERRR